ncbi:MAG: RluA family pseudouridine synthase [Candidatus Moraniibacteriota bacterium]
MEKIIITAEHVGKRIDKFLAEEFFLYSRGEVVEKIKAGSVLLGGKKIKPSYKLEEGDEIKLKDFNGEQKKLSPNNKIKLVLIFENENFLVINKPAGLQVHPTDCKQTDTLTNALLAQYPAIENVHDDSKDGYLRPGIVHRLDKDTSGVMVIAKNQATFDALKNIFKNRLITKKYLTIVEGVLENKKGIIEKSLARSAGFSKQLIARENTKTKIRQAVTNYTLIKEYANFSLLEVSPKTGRMHQIRVHLASLGHPVVGDKIYGNQKDKQSQLARQLLHAQSLEFDLNSEHYVFEAKLPADFIEFTAKIKDKKQCLNVII